MQNQSFRIWSSAIKSREMMCVGFIIYSYHKCAWLIDVDGNASRKPGA